MNKQYLSSVLSAQNQYFHPNSLSKNFKIFSPPNCCCATNK